MRLAFLTVVALVSPLSCTEKEVDEPAPTPFEQAVLQAMQGEIRTAEERTWDAERQPVQVLEFVRLEQDMRVLEVLPFSGWYTKILAPLLKENGKLYVTHPSPTSYSEAFGPVAGLPGLEEVEEIAWGAAAVGGTPFFAPGAWNVESVDLVLTFHDYQSFAPAARQAVNESSFDALKPGGLYGIVDRTDPVLVTKEAQDAGFMLLDFSQSVTGDSAPYALLFVKPEE
jgi:predicted methyltransferase